MAGTGVDGRRQIMGGTLYGALTDLATFDIVVRRAAGMRLTVIRDGAVAAVAAITADGQTVSYETPIGAADLEAFFNPVFLRLGPRPFGTQADLAQARAGRPAAAGGPARLSPGIGRGHATAPPTSTSATVLCHCVASRKAPGGPGSSRDRDGEIGEIVDIPRLSGV